MKDIEHLKVKAKVANLIREKWQRSTYGILSRNGSWKGEFRSKEGVEVQIVVKKHVYKEGASEVAIKSVYNGIVSRGLSREEIVRLLNQLQNE